MKKLFSFALILTLLMSIGCTIEESNEISQFEESTLSLLEILSDDALITSKRPSPPIWADCYKYRAIVTPANFKPESDPFDELYGGTTFAYGFPLISDSKPGDKDYNGGRWHLNVYIGSNPEAYADACSEEDIYRISMENGWNMEDFESTDTYFACPLIKYKN